MFTWKSGILLKTPPPPRTARGGGGPDLPPPPPRPEAKPRGPTPPRASGGPPPRTQRAESRGASGATCRGSPSRSVPRGCPHRRCCPASERRESTRRPGASPRRRFPGLRASIAGLDVSKTGRLRPAPQPPSYSAPSGPRAPPLRCWSPPQFGTSRGHLAVSSTSEVDPPRVGFSEAASPPHSPSKPPGREPGAAGQLCAGTPGDCTAARACTRAAGWLHRALVQRSLDPAPGGASRAASCACSQRRELPAPAGRPRAGSGDPPSPSAPRAAGWRPEAGGRRPRGPRRGGGGARRLPARGQRAARFETPRGGATRECFIPTPHKCNVGVSY